MNYTKGARGLQGTGQGRANAPDEARTDRWTGEDVSLILHTESQEAAGVAHD
jgi:hypothetical protein